MPEEPKYTEDELQERITHRTDEAAFKERVLGMLATILKDISEIKADQKDLQLKKMDKEVFTYSWEPRLTKVETENNKLQLDYSNDRRGVKVLLWALGGIWPMVMILVGALINYYLK